MQFPATGTGSLASAPFSRVEAALGGVPLDQLRGDTLDRLMDGQVREDDQIEFKQALYGKLRS